MSHLYLFNYLVNKLIIPIPLSERTLNVTMVMILACSIILRISIDVVSCFDILVVNISLNPLPNLSHPSWGESPSESAVVVEYGRD